MRKNDLIIAAAIALLIHTGLFLAPGHWTVTEAQVVFRSGESALTLTLVPSAASVEKQKAPEPVEEMDPTEFLKKNTPKLKQVKDPPKPREEPPKPVKVSSGLEIAQIANKIPPVKIHTIEIVEVEEIDRSISTDIQNPTVEVEEVEAAPKPKPVAAPAPEDSAASKEVVGDLRRKGVDQKARTANLRTPTYPRCCMRREREGKVLLDVTILADGGCGEIRVLKSGGCPKMDEAAVKAVRRARFIPARALGVPVTSSKKMRFTFELTDE